MPVVVITSSIHYHLESLEKDLRELDERFKKDQNDRWFVNYIFISEKIKERAGINLNPAVKELEMAKGEYAEKYKTKDLQYHADVAINECKLLKEGLRELYDLYKNQEKYERIRGVWSVRFPEFFRRIVHVRERLHILDRILSKEEQR